MSYRLFRGKRKDNGEWVYGYYVCLNEAKHFIYTGYAETDCGNYYPDYYEVIPETIGQYVCMYTREFGKGPKSQSQSSSHFYSGFYFCFFMMIAKSNPVNTRSLMQISA